MTNVVRALVVATLGSMALLIAGVVLSLPMLSRLGLAGMLLVPVVRNGALVVVEKRRLPRLLALLTGAALILIDAWFLRSS